MAIETELTGPLLLIAVPQLGDPNFHQTVVLVIEHNAEGAMGIILNRPSPLPVSAFFSSQDMHCKAHGTDLVFHGGPVQQDRAFLIHASSHAGPETEEMFDGVRLSYSMDSLKLLVDDPPERMRVFLGYAAWETGQLAKELTSGVWLVGTPSEALIFESSPEEMWAVALRNMGIEPMQLMHSGAIH